jgi:hypothetical protein
MFFLLLLLADGRIQIRIKLTDLDPEPGGPKHTIPTDPDPQYCFQPLYLQSGPTMGVFWGSYFLNSYYRVIIDSRQWKH